jgi:putative nucleotidyltransferase with HDIG domain
MARYAVTTKKNKLHSVPEKTKQAIEDIRSLNDSIYQAVSSNGPLPKAQIIGSCDKLIENLLENSIGSWMEAIRQFDSYTYRHCMTVSGIAVAFAMLLGMRKADLQRIAVGAMMHDVGKVRIPLSILDKPGKLSAEERVQINKHPGYGAEILRKDGQFDDEVVEIALYHHEFLDGTGYPDGLSGDQISDLVRIMTIVDIYSALVDKRSYKAAIPAEEAYQILLDMDGKLDRDILKAFKPTALAAQSSTQDAAKHQAMAS